MSLLATFQRVRSAIEREDFDSLKTLRIDKPEHFNWVEEIFRPLHVEAYPDDPALCWIKGTTSRHFSFREIYELGNQLVNFLRRHGIGQGDRIYSILPLVPANWITFLATIKGGFILMPTATNLKARDIEHRFETLFPEVMISTAENAEKIEQAERDFGQQIRLKVLVGGERKGWVPFSAIEQEQPEAEVAKTRSDDPFLYFFTSGTTGLPKVVVHTHFTYPVGHLATCTWVGTRHGDLHYNISAPGWAKFAWSSFFAPWNMGATIFALQTDAFVAAEQLEAMADHGVSSFCASPTVLRMLLQEDLSKYDLGLRTCAAAGEPLNPDVIDSWTKGTGVIPRDGYGQTETTCLVGNLPGAEIKPGSMGKPTFLYDILICDEEGQELPPLEEGNVCVRKEGALPNGLFVEYLEEQERTWRVFRHGLYYTGDKAYRDEDGYIWFVGRSDDVIKASAYRIGPFEVESVLNEHEAVLESAVVASPHPLRGSAVKAFVILQPGYDPGEALAQALFTFTEKHLPKYKVPRIIEFPEELPKTISGKIRRIELRSKEAQDKQAELEKEREFFHSKY